LVLDPFLGSGTTAVAAQNLGRQWVGIESNKFYVKIAEQRLAELKTMFDEQKKPAETASPPENVRPLHGKSK
jgi:site-specific DNA-methyltransferase (adenine-specific)